MSTLRERKANDGNEIIDGQSQPNPSRLLVRRHSKNSRQLQVRLQPDAGNRVASHAGSPGLVTHRECGSHSIGRANHTHVQYALCASFAAMTSNSQQTASLEVCSRVCERRLSASVVDGNGQLTNSAPCDRRLQVGPPNR
jgi:hypothetical protein